MEIRLESCALYEHENDARGNLRSSLCNEHNQSLPSCQNHIRLATMHARTHLPEDLPGTEVRLVDQSFFLTIAGVGSGEGGKSEVF